VNPDDTIAPGSSSPTSSEVREELSGDASRLAQSAKERATQEAETRKQQATQTARSASSALGRAADDLEQDDGVPSWLSSAFRQTASGIERLAGNVEGRGVDELARDVTRFARENPGAFLAASAAAGFAAARFLRAGTTYSNQHRYDAQSESASDPNAFGGASFDAGFDQAASTGGYGSDDFGTNTTQTGTGYGSTAGYGSSTSSTEPAGYGSNPVQGGPA
jgi:hypothetical protein